MSEDRNLLHRGIRALHVANPEEADRWMSLPCQIGLKCPHKAEDEDGWPLCIPPYTPESCPWNATFAPMDDQDLCPLVKDLSVLEALLRAYSSDGSLMVDVVDHINLIDEREFRRDLYSDGNKLNNTIVARALDAFWRMEG